jgi:hypothetical protein
MLDSCAFATVVETTRGRLLGAFTNLSNALLGSNIA